MTDWLLQYSLALDSRDAREKAPEAYVDAYTRLADRTASLERQRQQEQEQGLGLGLQHTGQGADTPLPGTPTGARGQPRWSPSPTAATAATTTTTTTARATAAAAAAAISTATAAATATGTATTTTLLSRLRLDLQQTQKTRSEQDDQLRRLQAELARATHAAATHEKQLGAAARERAALQQRLRDRDDEVRQKQRLVESVHDEMAGLTLELHMAEQRAARVRAENEMLVRRWMDKMGEEAERMNVESRWA